MRILVTGGTGFVGRHLIPKLEAAGHALTLSLRSEAASTRLPPALPRAARKSVVVGEIGEQTDWRLAIEGQDAVIHLAAVAHVLGDAAEDEAAFMRVNTLGTARLTESVVDAGVSRFVLMSSIGAVTSASEELVTLDTPCTPDTAYGRSKLAAEQALIEGTRDTRTSWTILRPTLVYGPGNPGNMERLVALVRRGIPLPLGRIRNRRSFTFVENLVDATVTAVSHPGAQNAEFLVADGQDLSTPELISRIAELSDARSQIIGVPLPLLRSLARGADHFSRATGVKLPLDQASLRRLESSLYVDIEALRTTLDWTPTIGVDEGLRCMLTPS